MSLPNRWHILNKLWAFLRAPSSCTMNWWFLYRGHLLKGVWIAVKYHRNTNRVWNGVKPISDRCDFGATRNLLKTSSMKRVRTFQHWIRMRAVTTRMNPTTLCTGNWGHTFPPGWRMHIWCLLLNELQKLSSFLRQLSSLCPWPQNHRMETHTGTRGHAPTSFKRRVTMVPS